MATRQVLAAYARRVGITFNSLNVNTMQQDIFEQTTNYIQDEFSSTALSTPAVTSTPDQSLILSPKNIREESASYWKEQLD